MQKKLFPVKGDFSKLGGWVQTSTSMSPLAVMQTEQARRQLWNLCFDCGGRHYSNSQQKRECAGDNNTCTYTCGVCDGQIRIASHGASTSILGRRSPAAVGRSDLRASANSRGPVLPEKRTAASALVAPMSSSIRGVGENATPAKRSRLDGSFARPSLSVQIAGSKYQTLPWFLGRVPTWREKKIAQDHAHNKLVELRKGDNKTLEKYNGQSILLPDTFAQFLGHKWVRTICRSARARDNLAARLVRDAKSPESANFLWLTTSLQKAFADMKTMNIIFVTPAQSISYNSRNPHHCPVDRVALLAPSVLFSHLSTSWLGRSRWEMNGRISHSIHKVKAARYVQVQHLFRAAAPHLVFASRLLEHPLACASNLHVALVPLACASRSCPLGITSGHMLV